MRAQEGGAGYTKEQLIWSGPQGRKHARERASSGRGASLSQGQEVEKNREQGAAIPVAGSQTGQEGEGPCESSGGAGVASRGDCGAPAGGRQGVCVLFSVLHAAHQVGHVFLGPTSQETPGERVHCLKPGQAQEP